MIGNAVLDYNFLAVGGRGKERPIDDVHVQLA